MASTLLLALLLVGPWPAHGAIHHTLDVTLYPEQQRLTVRDKVTLPPGHEGPVHFSLHAGLNPRVVESGVALQPSFAGKLSRLLGRDEQPPREQFRVNLKPGENAFTLEYGGIIHHAIAQSPQAYARSFQTSAGLISSEGVFLAGSSYWYPRFDDELVTFSLAARMPTGWHCVSQGQRTKQAEAQGRSRETWVADQPQEEIYLLAGALTPYADRAEPIAAMVFLREPDQDLAHKYLTATRRYLLLYEHLIGPYPYPKFALVENFWETGYGMPSFTALGPSVIRLPFIVDSSYPHEILHNWWGNGVYVDYVLGNWAEGLTSYLADHLLKEQQEQAVEYRRDALQRYTNYVREALDFPLSAFRGRHSATTEAVGYGKTLMLFHMLRQQLGDTDFIQGLRTLYRDRQFKRTDFRQVVEYFAAAAGVPLEAFFAQWVERTGAPSLRLASASAKAVPTGFRLSADLAQTQPGAPYRLSIPVAVHLQGRASAYQTDVPMDRKRITMELTLPARPLRLVIDPQFDVFRRLDRREIPPALSEAFAADRALAVLPASAPGELRQAYLDMATAWRQGDPQRLAIALDSELTQLPPGQTVWLFGWENRFRDRLAPALAAYRFADGGEHVTLQDAQLATREHTVVVAARRPENTATALTFVATEHAAALPGLTRKLPHYGKYSYLGFVGDQPRNVLKGQWPVVGSPLSVGVAQADGRSSPATEAELAPRAPLAELPSSRAAQRMMQDIEQLASPEMAGRGLGTAELDRAAGFIAREFAAAGLQPGGDGAALFYQTWTAEIGDTGRHVSLTNVIGILPGRNPHRAKESVVIGAHYDHLGKGDANARKADQGKIHPGADDNASGVAVLLALARALGKSAPPERAVVLVAFSAEEAGRLGSLHYLKHARRYPPQAIMGMINLDTVGRLESRELLVLGSGSAREWAPIFRGAGQVAGIAVTAVPHDTGASDQKSFQDHGIPAVQLFAGVHDDFHRPSDTADKIDIEGLSGVLAVVKEATRHLASRPDPLTAAQGARASTDTKPMEHAPARRRVRLGTVPDFAYPGQGVRLAGVTPDSPAAHAGLKKGDIIMRINHQSIAHLEDLSAILQSLRAGATLDIGFLRDGASRQTTARVVER